MMANFTITGEVVTKAARDLMLSDDPGRAWRLITDCLIGYNVESIAPRILAGEVNLAGDSKVGVRLEDADPDEAADYAAQLRYIYAGRVRLGGRWYRPRGIVVAFGPDDAKAAGPSGGRASLVAWSRRRAEFYAGPGERVKVVKKVAGELDDRHVVFEPCGEPPQWLTPITRVQDAVDESLAAGRALERLGAFLPESPRAQAHRIILDEYLDDGKASELKELAEEAEIALHAETLIKIAAEVRARAADNFFPLELLDGRVIQVPRAPFVHWALSRLPDIRLELLPPWTPVSPSGIKMQCDDPFHTDWVLGAGLTIEEGYDRNVTDPAWEKASELQFEEVDRA